jgi:hypothetical protein
MRSRRKCLSYAVIIIAVKIQHLKINLNKPLANSTLVLKNESVKGGLPRKHSNIYPLPKFFLV